MQAGEAHVAADVAQLVSTILGLGSASSCGGGPAGSAGSLTLCLNTVADPSVLALATDATLAKLLNGLQPLLRWDAATRQWAPAPGIAAALAPLQASCQVGAALFGRSLVVCRLIALPARSRNPCLARRRSACAAPRCPATPAWRRWRRASLCA